jgi:superfamily II DNA helicase RecQ
MKKLQDLIQKLERKIERLGKIKRAMKRTVLNIIFKIFQLERMLEVIDKKNNNDNVNVAKNVKDCFNKLFPIRKLGQKTKTGYFLIGRKNECLLFCESRRDSEKLAQELNKKGKAIICFSVPDDYKFEPFYLNDGEVCRLQLTERFIREYLFEWILSENLIF